MIKKPLDFLKKSRKSYGRPKDLRIFALDCGWDHAENLSWARKSDTKGKIDHVTKN
jgi:hypothetical protein